MTPQQLYVANDDDKKWYASVFQSVAGEKAAQAVFSQYCHDLGSAIDGGTAIALNAKRQGALELIQRMARFTLTPEPVKSNPLDSPLIDTTVHSGSGFPVRKPKTP